MGAHGRCFALPRSDRDPRPVWLVLGSGSDSDRTGPRATIIFLSAAVTSNGLVRTLTTPRELHRPRNLSLRRLGTVGRGGARGQGEVSDTVRPLCPFVHQQARVGPEADERFARSAVTELTTPRATWERASGTNNFRLVETAFGQSDARWVLARDGVRRRSCRGRLTEDPAAGCRMPMRASCARTAARKGCGVSEKPKCPASGSSISSAAGMAVAMARPPAGAADDHQRRHRDLGHSRPKVVARRELGVEVRGDVCVHAGECHQPAGHSAHAQALRSGER